jgi:hypothetical protein
MISFGGVVSAFAVSRTRLRLLFQVLATVATLGWVPGNPAKLMTMVVIWLLGFGRIRAAELVAMAAVNLLFVLMNQAALKQGTFVFDDPDLLGMPAYEFLTWGFYTLHTMRFLNGPLPQGRWIIVAGATGAFAVPFGPLQILILYSLPLLPCSSSFSPCTTSRSISPMPATWPWWVNWLNTSARRPVSGTTLGSLGAASRCGYCRYGPGSDYLHGVWSFLWCSNRTGATHNVTRLRADDIAFFCWNRR